MTCKRIYPNQPSRIQCNQPFIGDDYNLFYLNNREEKYVRLGKDPDKCGKFATHLIDGEYLCSSHAGMKALKILEERDDNG